MKFNLYEALQNNGFTVDPYNDGDNGYMVRDDFENEVEVAWYGKQKSTLEIGVQFNESRTVCTVYYYKDGFKRAFKVKTHLTDKRAFNAIRETVKNNGFEF